MRKRQPMQPLVRDEHGTVRFQKNAIVEFLLDHCGKHGVDLNKIACMDFHQGDQEQFAQLIGYSVWGFGELGYVRDETYNQAVKAAEAMPPCESPKESPQGEDNG
jgi:hypothetical protein